MRFLSLNVRADINVLRYVIVWLVCVHLSVCISTNDDDVYESLLSLSLMMSLYHIDMVTSWLQVFPKGWDKTFCLQYLNDFDEVYFFGDKTYKGGNDHEIYESERTIGSTVTSPDDTMQQVRALFMKQ